jgi:SAM-dependent methyltransferase
VVRALLPAAILEPLERRRRQLIHFRNRRRSLREIFTEVYENHSWGGWNEDYYSGSGSDDTLARPYAETVRRFIQENQVQSIVDLGCGDFRVGSRLQGDGVSYLGIDVVPALIASNQAQYGSHDIAFACFDIIASNLPNADLCLIRQVFQHLSNEQIHAVLRKLHQYRFVLVTDHYPPPEMKDVVPNKDKPAGPDTRILDHSGVFLDRTPFGLTPKCLLLDLEVPNWLATPGERIKTFVFEYPEPTCRLGQR